MRLQRCSASAKSTLGKKQGGSNVPAGKSGRGEPLAAINQSRRGSFLAAKVAHFLAATDKKGMKICQLILEEVHGTPEKGYEGVFAMQAPEGPPPASTAPEPTPPKRRRR